MGQWLWSEEQGEWVWDAEAPPEEETNEETNEGEPEEKDEEQPPTLNEREEEETPPPQEEQQEEATTGEWVWENEEWVWKTPDDTNPDWSWNEETQEWIWVGNPTQQQPTTTDKATNTTTEDVTAEALCTPDEAYLGEPDDILELSDGSAPSSQSSAHIELCKLSSLEAFGRSTVEREERHHRGQLLSQATNTKRNKVSYMSRVTENIRVWEEKSRKAREKAKELEAARGPRRRRTTELAPVPQVKERSVSARPMKNNDGEQEHLRKKMESLESEVQRLHEVIRKQGEAQISKADYYEEPFHPPTRIYEDPQVIPPPLTRAGVSTPSPSPPLSRDPEQGSKCFFGGANYSPQHADRYRNSKKHTGNGNILC